MALRFFALIVAACLQLQLSQAHVYDLPSTTAGYSKTNWATPGRGEWNSWNQPATISSIPQVSSLGPLSSILSTLAPFKSAGARTTASASAYPGSERPWSTPAPVPYSVERNWNTPALPPGSLNPAIPWTEQYWVTPAVTPNLIGAPEVTPQEANWNSWSGQNNAHAWSIAAPEVACITPQEANWNGWAGAADHNNIQLPAPIELPAPRTLPQAPVLPTVRQFPAAHQHLVAPHQLPAVHPLQGPGCHLPATQYLTNPYQVPAAHPLQPSVVRQVPLNHPLSAPFDPAQAHPLQLNAFQRFPGPIQFPSALWYY